MNRKASNSRLAPDHATAQIPAQPSAPPWPTSKRTRPSSAIAQRPTKKIGKRPVASANSCTDPRERVEKTVNTNKTIVIVRPTVAASTCQSVRTNSSAGLAGSLPGIGKNVGTTAKIDTVASAPAASKTNRFTTALRRRHGRGAPLARVARSRSARRAAAARRNDTRGGRTVRTNRIALARERDAAALKLARHAAACFAGAVTQCWTRARAPSIARCVICETFACRRAGSA